MTSMGDYKNLLFQVDKKKERRKEILLRNKPLRSTTIQLAIRSREGKKPSRTESQTTSAKKQTRLYSSSYGWVV